MSERRLIERISWQAILGGIIAFLGVFFGVSEYVFQLRPSIEKVVGVQLISFIEGAIIVTIVNMIILKLMSQQTSKSSG